MLHPLQQVPLRDISMRNVSDEKTSSRTEVSRLKFMINQMKGTMQESEMRASAAENRVAMLQKQIKDLVDKIETEDNKEKSGEEAAKLKEEYKEITSKLRKKVKKLTKAMDVFKSESEGEMQEIKSSHESEKIKWQTEYDELQSDLEIAGIELASAREEATNLGKEIKLLEKNMNELEALLLGQIEEVTTRKDNEISDIKVEAEDVRLTLVKEIEELEQQLSESELCSENLLQDLEEAKMELTNELISFKEKTKKELDAVQQSLKARDMDVASRDDNIETLESERTSLRKLFRLQGSLVKKRIRKRFRGEK